LLDTTHIRIGNIEYARTNQSYGLTTVRDRHVEIRGATLWFRFWGKSGKDHNVVVNDRRLASIVRRCEELPGYELFQYVDPQGQSQTIASGDVNDYLRTVSGQNYTAKDFRTWAGTLLAARALLACGAPISFARLQAMPTSCLCAVHAEVGSTTQAEETEEEVPESGPIPPDLALLSDEEIEEELWEQIRNDGRIESEELEIVCRQGVVFLSGALPSRSQHSILMQLVTDVLGFQEIVDRTEVKQLAWQREDRDKDQGTETLGDGIEDARESPRELYGSEDTIESEGEAGCVDMGLLQL
jgi:osmotically-inducible protein OsmY